MRKKRSASILFPTGDTRIGLIGQGGSSRLALANNRQRRRAGDMQRAIGTTRGRLLGTWGGTRVEEVVWAVVIWAHLTGRSAGEGNSSCCAIALLFILVLSNNSVLLLIYDSNQSNRQS